MRIPYIATNFPSGSSAALVGNRHLTTSWTDIVWAAVTAGKPGASHLLAHRWHSLADLVVRTHAVYANLQQRGQQIDRSPLYDSLDPTEKGATSYFLGMAMAKLFAAPLFATPWLFHVSMASGLGTTLSFKRGSKSQPDLIGQTTSGEWIIVEAKGRTNGLDANTLKKAKAQTRMIRTVNGHAPTLRVALQVYFADCLRVCVDDQDGSDPEAVDLHLDVDAAFGRYYAFVEAITAGSPSRENVRQRDFETVFDADSGITIGVESELLNDVAAGRSDRIRARRTGQRSKRVEGEDGAIIYPDSLLVRLDPRWSSSLMSLEPDARSG